MIKNFFPGIKVSDSEFFIQDTFLYTQILCFLTFNVCAMIGSILPSFFIWVSFKLLLTNILMHFRPLIVI